MAQYTQTTFFGPKDALTAGDPDKKVLGTEFDTEFSAISTAVNTNFDSTDVANTAEAQALTLNTVLITPQKLREALEGPTQTLDAVMDSLTVRTTDLNVTLGDLNVAAGSITSGAEATIGTTLSAGGAIDAPSIDITNGVTAHTVETTSTAGTDTHTIMADASNVDRQRQQLVGSGSFATYDVSSDGAVWNNAFGVATSTGEVNFNSFPTVGFAAIIESYEGRTGAVVVADDDTTIYNIDDSTATNPLPRGGNDRNFLSDADKLLIGTSLQTGGSIDQLADVDTTTSAPVTDEFLQWDGSDWIPAVPALSAGSARFEGVASSTGDQHNFTTTSYDTITGNGVATIDNTVDFSQGWTITADVDCIVNLTYSYEEIRDFSASWDDGTPKIDYSHISTRVGIGLDTVGNSFDGGISDVTVRDFKPGTTASSAAQQARAQATVTVSIVLAASSFLVVSNERDVIYESGVSSGSWGTPQSELTVSVQALTAS